MIRNRCEYKWVNSKIKNKCYILKVINSIMIHLKELNILLLLLTLPLITGCEKEDINPFIFNGKELNKIITSYSAGDSAAVSTAGFLFNNADPELIDINTIHIDSTVTTNNKTIYSLLLEANNPVFNLFVLVDDKMNVLLYDNSLNGYLNGSFQTIQNKTIYVLTESFKSKDIFNLQRTSLYTISEASIGLLFRALTEISFDNSKITSRITSFTNKNITLSFEVKNTPQFRITSDEFLYDQIADRYSGEKNYLRNYALNEINKFKTTSKIHEITDLFSYRRAFSGRTSDPVNIEILKTDFIIKLSEDWREFENFSIKHPLKNEFRGTKYINNKIGASISLIKLPLKDSTEIYTDILLTKEAVYKHPVKFSELIESGKHFMQIIEYTCGTNKVSMIIEAPKFTYEKNKEIYDSVIKSFKINC